MDWPHISSKTARSEESAGVPCSAMLCSVVNWNPISYHSESSRFDDGSLCQELVQIGHVGLRGPWWRGRSVDHRGGSPNRNCWRWRCGPRAHVDLGLPSWRGRRRRAESAERSLRVLAEPRVDAEVE